jgi:hypothetical protein
MIQTPEGNIIKLPNISASVPQLVECIAGTTVIVIIYSVIFSAKILLSRFLDPQIL